MLSKIFSLETAFQCRKKGDGTTGRKVEVQKGKKVEILEGRKLECLGIFLSLRFHRPSDLNLRFDSLGWTLLEFPPGSCDHDPMLWKEWHAKQPFCISTCSPFRLSTFLPFNCLSKILPPAIIYSGFFRLTRWNFYQKVFL